MERIREYREIWAVPFPRLLAFFRNTAEEEADGNRLFCRGCQVRLTPLPAKEIAHARFPQTEVFLSGPAPLAEELHHEFQMAFLSAGG